MKKQNSFVAFHDVVAYDASALNCFAFRHGYDVKGGLSLALGNMVAGFPFSVEGVRFLNSECAYIAGIFSSGSDAHLELQRRLVECDNGFMAKKDIRQHNKALQRTDWEEFNVEWMLFVVWQKCMGNADFRKVLLALPHDAVIIEDSTFQAGQTATVWGTRNAELKTRLNALKKSLLAKGMTKAAVKREQDRRRLGEWSRVGVFEGMNIMGKILMICREALVNGCEPVIDYALLRSKHINLLGKELNFSR